MNQQIRECDRRAGNNWYHCFGKKYRIIEHGYKVKNGIIFFKLEFINQNKIVRLDITDTKMIQIIQANIELR